MDVYPFSGDRAVLFMYSASDGISLPPEIRVIKEVTGDPAYKNKHLAHIQAL